VLWTGLSNSERAVVYKLLQDGSDAEKLFKIDELLATPGVTQKIAEAYFAMRSNLDFAHFMVDRSLIKEARLRYGNAKAEEVSQGCRILQWYPCYKECNHQTKVKC
jgi:hypothetical protein